MSKMKDMAMTIEELRSAAAAINDVADWLTQQFSGNADEPKEQPKKEPELKLEDVREVKELKVGQSICRELVLITVGVTPEERTGLICLVNAFHHANIVDIEKDSIMIEMTENHEKINAFISLLDGYEIKEMVRTGIAGLTRGAM